MEGVPCPRIEGLTDKFSSLARLSIVNCGLTTLEGLPSLPKLNTVCGGSSLTHTHTHTQTHTCANVHWCSFISSCYLVITSYLEQLK